MSETFACTACGRELNLAGVDPEEMIVCPGCDQVVTRPVEAPAEFDDLDLNAVDFDSLVAAESAAPAAEIPPANLPRSNEPAEDHTDALLRSYGASEENLQKLLPASGIDGIQRGLRLHFVATIAFTLFLVFGSIGVGTFCGAAMLAGYVAESESMTSELEITDEARETQARKNVTLLSIAAIMLIVALIFLILGAVPLAASVGIDVFASMMCMKFPEEKGARLMQILSASFKAIAGLFFVMGLVISLLLGLPAAAALLVGLAAALLPVGIAWACFLGSLERLSDYLDREDLVREARQLLVVGLITVGVLVALPIGSIVLIASGNGYWLVGILFAAGLAYFWMVRQDPVTYLVEGLLYLSSLKFCIGYANYLSTLQLLVSRTPTDPRC